MCVECLSFVVSAARDISPVALSWVSLEYLIATYHLCCTAAKPPDVMLNIAFSLLYQGVVVSISWWQLVGFCAVCVYEFLAWLQELCLHGSQCLLSAQASWLCQVCMTAWWQ